MVPHLNAHLSGALAGQVPEDWLRRRGKTACRVCVLCAAANRPVHPTCRPAQRAAVGTPGQPRTP
eukprot:2845544-Alexandrium_andersonii.AAC.1